MEEAAVQARGKKRVSRLFFFGFSFLGIAVGVLG